MGDNQKLKDLLSDLVTILEDKAKLEANYYCLQMDHCNLLENMQKSCTNYLQEKESLTQEIKCMEDKLKEKELKETQFKEQESMLKCEKKMYKTQLNRLKDEIEREKHERNRLECQLLEDLKYLQKQLKNTFDDWIITKEKYLKIRSKINKNKPNLNKFLNDFDNNTNTRKSNIRPNKETITNYVALMRNREALVLEELFFRKNPFNYSYETLN